jgi:hypothetical protein
MKDTKDIKEDEIRVIGGEGQKPTHRRWRVLIWILLGCAVLATAMLFILLKGEQRQPEEEPAYFDPQPVVAPPEIELPKRLGKEIPDTARGFIEIRDTTINDIPLRIFIPHNAEASLHVGKLDKRDTTIVFAAQAADIRADNKKIVGAFVLKGEPLAWGLSKTGYCAIIEGVMTIGMAENSPLFEEATEKGGYFFRQYPLVDNGRLVENEPKNKAIRRALCDREGEFMMVESGVSESFHDFAQALVDLGVTNAIYLVGSNAFGWAVDDAGMRTEFGEENNSLPRNTSYLVWRRP